MFGAGGGTSSYEEIEHTDLILLWGSNARAAHPIFFHHVLKGIHNGAEMIVVDPRRTESAEWGDLWLGIDVGTDIALSNTIAREIIVNDLQHHAFIEHATDGVRGVPGLGHGLDPRARRSRHRGAGRGHPGGRARVREGRSRR